MWPTGNEVYQINARPVSVVGKNLHNNTGLVVYSSINFLYAIICSYGQLVPSKGAIFGTLILTGLGLANTSTDNGEFINIGASSGPPRLNSSRGIVMGLAGWLDHVSRVIFRSSRFLSMRD